MKNIKLITAALLSSSLLVACPGVEEVKSESGNYSDIKASLIGTSSKIIDLGSAAWKKIDALSKSIGQLPNVPSSSTNYPVDVTNPDANTEARYNKLPRFTFDCSSGTCPEATTASEDYIIKWKAGSDIAELVVDWDGSSSGSAKAPVKVFISESNISATKKVRSYQELPVNVYIKFKVGAVTVFDGSANGAFRKQADEASVFTLNPLNVVLKATGQNLDGTGLAKINNFSLDFNGGVKFNLDASLKVDANEAKVKIAQTSGGDVTFWQQSNGYIQFFDVSGFKPKGDFSSSIILDVNKEITQLTDKGTTEVDADGNITKITVTEAKLITNNKSASAKGSYTFGTSGFNDVGDATTFTFKDGDKKLGSILREEKLLSPLPIPASSK